MTSETRSLVFHSGALGDFITCLPAITRWKEITPGSRHVLAAGLQTGRFACECADFDEFIDITAPSSSFLFGEDRSRLLSFLSGFRSALLFTNSKDLTETAKVLNMSPLLSQAPFPTASIPIHQYHLSIFDTSGELDYGIKIPDYYLEKSSKILPKGRRAVAIHPGSGSSLKNWPSENFLALSEKLNLLDFDTVWIRGPAEKPSVFPNRDFVLENLPLPLLTAVISRCKLYVGNDSGPSHLSAALGVPTFVIFGPSDPLVWRPAGPSVTILTKNFPCSPCHRKFVSTDCNSECLRAITVEEVQEAIINHKIFLKSAQ